MTTSVKNQGVTGKLQVLFAIPSDDPHKWQLRNGYITYDNGATVGIHVDGGNIPFSKGKHGLTVTYFTVTNLALSGVRGTGDITMRTCIDGRVMEVEDIAFGVEVVAPAEATPDGENSQPN